MSNTCTLCQSELVSMDTLLGENRLSDGGKLCNKCLEKVSGINQELLYNLHEFSIDDIKSLVQNTVTEQEKPIEKSEELNISIFENAEPGSMPRELYKRRLKEIKYELIQVNANLSMFTKGEIKELPRILNTGERIIAATDAQLSGTLDAGILLVTHHRMVSVSKGVFSALKVNEYLNEVINEISIVKNPLSPVIKIHMKEGVVEFECFFDKDDAERFYSSIEKIYNTPKSEKQVTEVKEVSSEHIFEQLEKLGKLRENGILTEEEFAEQKKKLLGQLP
ncbi:SHOCT domain-containing protein [Chryseobacterium angstadtii]|nr:SHOCT domain-containing protein [Chryseobacterium angstadtii]